MFVMSGYCAEWVQSEASNYRIGAELVMSRDVWLWLGQDIA